MKNKTDGDRPMLENTKVKQPAQISGGACVGFIALLAAAIIGVRMFGGSSRAPLMNKQERRRRVKSAGPDLKVLLSEGFQRYQAGELAAVARSFTALEPTAHRLGSPLNLFAYHSRPFTSWCQAK